MEKKCILLGIILIASFFSCDNSESLSAEKNHEFGLKVNILNYTENEYKEGTMIYLGAIVKDTFIAVDSIEVNKKILSSKVSRDSKHSVISIPENEEDELYLDLWDINIEDIKEISNKGGVLVRFPDQHCEVICNQFACNENELVSSFGLNLNISKYEIGFHSIDVKIEENNILLRKNSNIVFKQIR
jgi:hypothetical protein